MKVQLLTVGGSNEQHSIGNNFAYWILIAFQYEYHHTTQHVKKRFSIHEVCVCLLTLALTQIGPRGSKFKGHYDEVVCPRCMHTTPPGECQALKPVFVVVKLCHHQVTLYSSKILFPISLHKQLQNVGYVSLSVATPANVLSSVFRNAEGLGNFTLRKWSFLASCITEGLSGLNGIFNLIVDS